MLNTPSGANAVQWLSASPQTGTFANNIFFSSNCSSNLNITLSSNGGTLNLTGNNYFCSFGIVWTLNGTAYGSLAAVEAAGFEKVSGNAVGTSANPNLTGTFPAGNCGGYSTSCPTAYKLTSSSIHTGKGNGLNLNSIYGYNVGTQDFYGNPISASTLPIGAAGNDRHH
jgi:hypothetical protein